VGDLIELGPDDTSIIEHGHRRPSSFDLLYLDTHSVAALFPSDALAAPFPSDALAAAPSVPVGAAPSAPLCVVVRDVALLGNAFASVRNYLQSRWPFPVITVVTGCMNFM
jgi:hypothetical protein